MDRFALHSRRGGTIGLSAWLLVGCLMLGLANTVHAKPINSCVAESEDPLVDELGKAGVPGVDCAALPHKSPANARNANKTPAALASQRPLPGAGDNALSSPDSEQVANCSALRGTHEAKSTMLQSIQGRLADLERRQSQLRRAVTSMRSNGAGRQQMVAVSARLSEATAVLDVLRAEFLQRSEEFNSSMNRLTRACLRG